MFRKAALIGVMAVSVTPVMAAEDGERPKSISVLNLLSESVDLWVNGEYRELRAGVAMLQPCLVGEKVEVQVNMDVSYLACGETKEIGK